VTWCYHSRFLRRIIPALLLSRAFSCFHCRPVLGYLYLFFLQLRFPFFFFSSPMFTRFDSLLRYFSLVCSHCSSFPPYTHLFGTKPASFHFFSPLSLCLFRIDSVYSDRFSRSRIGGDQLVALSFVCPVPFLSFPLPFFMFSFPSLPPCSPFFFLFRRPLSFGT